MGDDENEKRNNIQERIEFWSHLMEVLAMHNNTPPRSASSPAQLKGRRICFLGFWKILSKFPLAFFPSLFLPLLSPLPPFHKCFLSTYYVPGTTLDTEDITILKQMSLLLWSL